MSVRYNGNLIAGTPEVATVVEAGNTKPVTSGAVKSALNTVDESIAIRVSGNTTAYASGAAIGQYVIVDGSTITGITDGMYKAAKAIPYNTAIDSTYLTAVSGGGLNDLKAAMGLSFLYGTVSNVSINIPVGMTEIQFPAPPNVAAVYPKFIWVRMYLSKVISCWECYPTYPITNSNAWYFNVFSQRSADHTLTSYDYVVAY